MKNLVRLAVAGALVAGYHSAAFAQAATQPSSDAADLWLFVSDPSAGTTFAEDTGITVNSLMPSADFVTGAELSTAIDDNATLAATSALTAYINAANGAGQSLEWGVEAVQFLNSTSQAKTGSYPGYKNPGGIIAITDNGQAPANTEALQLGNLQTWGTGFQGDISYLTTGSVTSYVSGGTTYAFSEGTTGGNVWGVGTGNTGGSTDEYGQGPAQTDPAFAPGGTAELYGLTGNSGTGEAQSYELGTVELTAAGELIISSVPLPPAVWLFASGLLGLAGVGRRRAATAA